MNSLDCFCYSACHSYWNHSECNNLVGNISRSPEVSLEMTGWHCPILYVVICANPRLEIIVPFKGNRINPCIRSVLIDQAKAEYMTNTHWKATFLSLFTCMERFLRIEMLYNVILSNLLQQRKEKQKKETMEKNIFVKYSANYLLV